MKHTLRYGENPQATAELIADEAQSQDPLSIFNLINPDGSPLDYSALSYINVSDTDRLLNTVTLLAAALAKNPSTGSGHSIAAAVKHGHICGAAVGDTPEAAVTGMYKGDSRAVFGGFIMCNFTIGKEAAHTLMDAAAGKTYLAGIIAPAITNEAIEILPKQKRACQLICLPALADLDEDNVNKELKKRPVRGGYIEEKGAQYIPESDNLDLLLGWAVGSTSVSNTITLVKNGMVIGNGVGQQDRVSACELAIKRAVDAGHEVAGAFAYSDSFFPFTDGVEILANAGVKTIFATSGSVKDKKVQEFAKDREVELILAPDKEARGFFGH